MKPIINACLVILLGAARANADRVGQGAGSSENNIAFAYEYLDKYLQICLATEGCLDPGDQTKVVQQVYSDFQNERAHAGQIGFKFEKDEDFYIDHMIRIAKTWPYVGAPILFNLNQLYKQDANGKIQEVTIQQAVGYLVHEMGHHHGWINHTWLDDVGHRVSRVLDGRIFSGMIYPGHPNIRWMTLFFDDNSPGLKITQLLVTDGPNLYDVGDLTKIFHCPQFNGMPSILTALPLWNIQVRNFSSANPILVSYALPSCLGNDHVPRQLTEYGVDLQTALIAPPTKDGLWTFDPKGFVLSQVTCFTEPLMCHWRSLFEKRFVKTIFNPFNLESPKGDLDQQEEVP